MDWMVRCSVQIPIRCLRKWRCWMNRIWPLTSTAIEISADLVDPVPPISGLETWEFDENEIYTPKVKAKRFFSRIGYWEKAREKRQVKAKRHCSRVGYSENGREKRVESLTERNHDNHRNCTIRPARKIDKKAFQNCKSPRRNFERSYQGANLTQWLSRRWNRAGAVMKKETYLSPALLFH